MKYPRMPEVVKANKRLKVKADETYRRILGVALTQYARVSGDARGLGLLRSRSFDKLLTWADSLVDVVHSTADLHFAASQTAALIRKYPWNPSVVKTDPEGKAVATFNAAEHRCRRMNQWFSTRVRASRRRRADQWEAYLSSMRAWIRYVIGDTPDLMSIYESADVTGGASVDVHGDATNVARKLLAQHWTVTPPCLPYLASALSHNASYATRVAKRNNVVQSLHVEESDLRDVVRMVSSNKVAFVPKTAKTDRSIAVEPLGNGLLQKGTDLLMRKRLRRVGLDLSDQTLNQKMAREGSLSEGEESFCTIDLSSASDSVSIGLVKEVLPADWFRFLDRIRSPSYSYKGVEKRSEKFCTMGNGFCFPLETLIFAAACHAVQAGVPGVDFRVYGDDIIVRKKYFTQVVNLLNRLGFRTNSRKTFASGPFRESCGANWYSGEEVTPFTLDYRLDSLQAMFKFVNLARRNAKATRYCEEMVRLVLNRIPDRLLFWRPFKGAPDTGIDPAGLEFTPLYWRRHQGMQCPSWCELESHPVKDDIATPDWVVMAAVLRGGTRESLFTYRRKVVWRVRVIARSGDLVPLEPVFVPGRHVHWATKIRRLGR